MTGDGSFYNLFHAYGYPEAQDYQYEDEGRVSSAMLNGPEQNITLPPMYFVRGGAIIQSPRSWGFREGGYYQSSVGGNSGNGDNAPLIIYNGRFYISYDSQRRYTGNSVRCLAR